MSIDTIYKVKKVYQPSGLPTWTVVQTVDGQATGGDHYWLTETLAYLVLYGYVHGVANHGDSETTVLRKLGMTR